MAFPADTIAALITIAEGPTAPKQAIIDVLRALADPAAGLRYQSRENIIQNGNMEFWPTGLTGGPGVAPPRGWTTVGAGATFARTGTNKKLGLYAGEITRVGTDAYFNEDLDAGPFYGLDFLRGTRLGLGAWVRATVASRARIGLVDSAGSSFSAYHTGGGAWEWLTATRVIDGAATSIDARLQVDTGNTTAQFDGASCVVGDAAPAWGPHVRDFHAEARVTRGVKAIPTGVTTAIDWSAAAIDDYNFWAVGNPTRIVAPFAGTMIGTANVGWASGGGANRTIDWLLDGTTGLPGDSEIFAITTVVNQSLGFMRRVVAGQYVELRVFHDHGSNLNATPTAEVYMIGA